MFSKMTTLALRKRNEGHIGGTGALRKRNDGHTGRTVEVGISIKVFYGVLWCVPMKTKYIVHYIYIYIYIYTTSLSY